MSLEINVPLDLFIVVIELHFDVSEITYNKYAKISDKVIEFSLIQFDNDT